MIVGTPVVVECDGWEFHVTSRTQFARDRERDAMLSAAGYVVVRVTWSTSRAGRRDRPPDRGRDPALVAERSRKSFDRGACGPGTRHETPPRFGRSAVGVTGFCARSVRLMSLTSLWGRRRGHDCANDRAFMFTTTTAQPTRSISPFVAVGSVTAAALLGLSAVVIVVGLAPMSFVVVVALSR